MLSYTSLRQTGDDNSWEVRAFAEDTSSSSPMWPPRSYTCSFCDREFRSAQALGGHMNVHRKDRAQLRQYAQGGAAASPAMLSSGGGAIFYSISNAGAGPVFALPVAASFPYESSVHNSPVPSSLLDKVGMFREYYDDGSDDSSDHSSADGTVVEELDLELRLGW